MIIKNMKKYFTFEVQVLDDKNVRRRFRASNYQSMTRVKPFICTMPMVCVLALPPSLRPSSSLSPDFTPPLHHHFSSTPAGVPHVSPFHPFVSLVFLSISLCQCTGSFPKIPLSTPLIHLAFLPYWSPSFLTMCRAV
jgi:hypothetical protein